MTAPYRKKLIEVALPLKAINEASAREKSIRHGHPSTLHLWWARRPLAACRAVLFASLVDDPDSDPVFRKPNGKVDEEAAGIKRAELFNLIEELVQWENSNNPRVINAARAEIARCVASRKIELGELTKDTIIYGESKGKKQTKKYADDGTTAGDILLMKSRPEVVNAFLAEYAPPVLDPFCGGGSIPLEAQRLGLRAYGSDLNPVPVLITKALIEIPPKFAGQPPVNPEWQAKSKEAKAATSWQGAQGLAEDVRYYGQWMRSEAEKRIGHLYPKVKVTNEMAKDRPDLNDYVGQELTVIAWLWARTVASPNPTCRGIHVPLLRSFWLSTKKGNEAWVEPVIDRRNNTVSLELGVGAPKHRGEIAAGTKIGRGCKFKCIISNQPIPEDHIKSSGMLQQLGTSLLAAVVQAGRKRLFISPKAVGEEAIQSLPPPSDLKGIDAPISEDKRALWCLLYGQTTFNRLFTNRQLTSLGTLCDLVDEARLKCMQDSILTQQHANSEQYADAIALYLAEASSKTAAFHCTQAAWRVKECKSGRAFGRQAMPMVWDFAEVNPFADAGGGWNELFESATKTIRELPACANGIVEQRDATQTLIVDNAMVSTDPPYYDNVGYSDLSDFYYVWLRRSLKARLPMLFSTVVCPKREELIASPYRYDGDFDKARSFFENGLRLAFGRMRSVQISSSPFTVYYAFKQAETDDNDTDDELASESNSLNLASTGWETMLEGLFASGFSVVGTWPMRTESVVALKANVNALASSIVLVCRPRPTDAQLATRKDFISSLRQELPEALKNLQHGNIAPVDLAQSAIGPGMAVYTRYSKVIESDGSSMPVRSALGIINQVLDEVLAEQEGDFDADTRWALAWFEQHGMGEGPFGIAETLSKAKNTAVNGLVEAGVIKAKSGKVQLLKRTELPTDWNPATDKRLTVWETTQHLIRILETQGEGAAATLLHQLGGIGETARELAYRLYSICERKKWADEALAYNSLVIAWPELSKLAIATRYKQAQTPRQNELFN